MVKKKKLLLANVRFDPKSLIQDMKIADDLLSGRRKRPPRSWGRHISVDLPTAQWVRAFRRSLKLDFHDFGGLAGVQDADVREWESGKSRPSASASRLLGLLSLKPHLVKFMRSEWPDDQITKDLKMKRRKAPKIKP